MSTPEDYGNPIHPGTGLFSDISIKTGDNKIIKAHKVILYNKLPSIRQLLINNVFEITIPLSEQQVMYLLKCIYHVRDVKSINLLDIIQIVKYSKDNSDYSVYAVELYKHFWENMKDFPVPTIEMLEELISLNMKIEFSPIAIKPTKEIQRTLSMDMVRRFVRLFTNPSHRLLWIIHWCCVDNNYSLEMKLELLEAFKSSDLDSSLKREFVFECLEISNDIAVLRFLLSIGFKLMAKKDKKQTSMREEYKEDDDVADE